MADKKALLKKLLKGLETGDPDAAAVVNEAKYIQHNPQTHEGSEGLAVLFQRLAKTNPKVTFCRVFEDGDFAFAHILYDFSSLRAAFEVFRFEEGYAVEHWDNIQPLEGPNPSGRSMLDGATDITDLDRTEANRDLIRRFTEAVLIGGEHKRLEEFAVPDLRQHSPQIGDGTNALREALQAEGKDAPHLRYRKVHRVLAEGNFVLCVSEGAKDGVHSSFYDLYRLAGGKIAEHWDTIEAVPPRSEWKNDNGKF